MQSVSQCVREREAVNDRDLGFVCSYKCFERALPCMREREAVNDRDLGLVCSYKCFERALPCMREREAVNDRALRVVSSYKCFENYERESYFWQKRVWQVLNLVNNSKWC